MRSRGRRNERPDSVSSGVPVRMEMREGDKDGGEEQKEEEGALFFFSPHLLINSLPSDSSSSSSASRARISNGIGDASRSPIRLVPN